MFVLIQCHKRRHSKSATSSWPDKANMPWDRKRLLGYVETIQLILGVTDKTKYQYQKLQIFFFLTLQAPITTAADDKFVTSSLMFDK